MEELKLIKKSANIMGTGYDYQFNDGAMLSSFYMGTTGETMWIVNKGGRTYKAKRTVNKYKSLI